MAEGVRIDKWLWAVRLFKTRSLATEACKKGKVKINGTEAKASRMVSIGDKIELKRPPLTYSYLVKGLLEKRQSAKIAADHIENLTPEEELVKLEQNLSIFVKRDRGAGRPTKKERRDIEGFLND